MRFALALVVVLTAVLPEAHVAHADGQPDARAPQPVHFPMATRLEDAQRRFDAGLAQLYSADRDGAVAAFDAAAALDPTSPLPLWGIALALSPSVDAASSPTDLQRAAEAVRRASALAVRAPAKERAFVAALARRYPDDADRARGADDYREAMRQLVRTYPNDLHAATLFAESQMAAMQWQLWTPDGSPLDGTQEILETLERVLDREPTHIGAIHLYIHATEASLTPERALRSVGVLEQQMPTSPHLLHLPSHTELRAGLAQAAVTANRKAVVALRGVAATLSPGQEAELRHILDSLASAATASGQLAEALRAAEELERSALPAVSSDPSLQPYAVRRLFVLLRFSRWNDVLAAPPPSEPAPLVTALRAFARGVARAALHDAPDAEQEREAYRAARRQISGDARWLDAPAAPLLAVADRLLDARIASASGDTPDALAAWQQAIVAEDALPYHQPSAWFPPAREALAVTLFRLKRYEQADLVLRQELERNPGSGRALFARWQVLKVSDGDIPGTLVAGRRYQDAWNGADTPLSLSDY